MTQKDKLSKEISDYLLMPYYIIESNLPRLLDDYASGQDKRRICREQERKNKRNGRKI